MNEIQNAAGGQAATVKPSLSEFDSLLKRSWAVYIKGIRTYVKLMVLPLGGMAVVFAAVAGKLFAQRAWAGPGTVEPDIDIAFILILGSGALFTIYLSLVSQAGVLIAIKEDDRPGVFTDLFRRAHRLVLPLFWVGMLSAVIVLFFALLLFVPGIIAAMNFTFASWVLVYEGKRGYDALRESKRLIYGYRMAVLGRLALLYLVFMVGGMMFGLIINALPDDGLVQGALGLVLNAVQFLLGPLFIIYQREMYLELKALNPAPAAYAG